MKTIILIISVACALLVARIDSLRLPFIAGNWKMNTDLRSAIKLANDLVQLTKDTDKKKVEIAIFVPYPFIRDVKRVVEGSSIKVGAQNIFYESKGAYTAAVSASMLSSIDCEYVLVGHSERRAIFGESDIDINRSLKQVMANGMKPVLCIGETREEYELGLNNAICAVQLSRGLAGLSAEEVSNVVIAYEPVWAIGTGLSATPEIAQSVHADIRGWLMKRYGGEVAQAVRIQYGGSVTPESVDELMNCPDIDGALVGGASLQAKSFARIINYQ